MHFKKQTFEVMIPFISTFIALSRILLIIKLNRLINRPSATNYFIGILSIRPYCLGLARQGLIYGDIWT